MNIVRAYFDGSYNRDEDLGGLGVVILRNNKLEDIYRETVLDGASDTVVDLLSLELLSRKIKHLKADKYEICGDFLDGLTHVEKIITGQWQPRFGSRFHRYIRRVVKNLFFLRTNLCFIYVNKEQNKLAHTVARQASGVIQYRTEDPLRRWLEGELKHMQLGLRVRNL